MKLTIDLDDLVKLKEEGSKIVLDPEAEQSILKLLKAQTKIEKALDELKEKIAEEGLKHNKNFKSVESDNIRIWYRYYGSRYSVDKNRIDEIPPELYREDKRYHPDTKRVEEYLDEHEQLPLGIIERDRSKTLSIKPKIELE